MMLGFNRYYLFSAILIASTFFSAGCTRKAESNLSLKLTIPTQSNLSSLTFPDAKLATAIVNVRIPGKNLFVKEVDFHDGAGGPQYGSAMTIDIPNVPSGSDALIQYLGVFETPAGQMLFSYGDTTVNISGAQTTADITATIFGNSNKQGRIAGRYITGGTNSSASTITGPTGTMIAYIMPPGGKPRMAVDKSYIMNGWFNIFVLDGTSALMTYELMDANSTKIFENVNLASFNTSSILHKKIVISKPVSYRKDYDAGGFQAEGAEDLILGFFAKDSTIVSDLGSVFSSEMQIAYPTASESIPGMYANATGSMPLHYFPSDTSGTKIKVNTAVSDGAIGASAAAMYTSGFDPSVAANLRFMPHLLGQGGHDTMFGIKPPFRIINEFQRYGGYLDAKFNGTNAIDLTWAYLPGIVTAQISGSIVYGKYSTTGGGDGGGDKLNCYEKAMSKGMTEVMTLSSTASAYSVPAVGGTNVNNSNYYNFSFLVCPFRDEAGKPREYFADAQSGCMSGGCGDTEHFGWGTTDVTLSAPTSYPANSTASVSSISLSTNMSHKYTTVVLGTDPTGILENDEVMLRVVSQDSSGCGTSVYNGQYSFARVLGRDASIVYIPRGTFLDNVTSGSNLTATPPAAGHCVIHVSKVLHYQNLSLASGGSLSALPFSSYTSGGGVLPLRVSGKLTFTSGNYLSADYMGFPNIGGGNGVGSTSSAGGMEGTTPNNGSGGGAGVMGNGGNGSASNGLGGMVSGGGGGMITLGMGASGGGAAGALGGAGGGLIFVMAREIESTGSGNSISANGYMGGSTTNVAGGGGGGGSVAVLTQKFTASPIAVSVYAQGGMGALNGSAGGGGGGGAISLLACDNSAATGFSVNSGSAGGGGGGVSGSTGTLLANMILDPAQYGLCH